MAQTPKLLGAARPSASTVTNVYTPGAGLWAVTSTLTIHNDNSSIQVEARLLFAPAGAADATSHRIYDVQVPALDTFTVTVGLCLNGTDVLRCWADTANVNFHAWGTEGP